MPQRKDKQKRPGKLSVSPLEEQYSPPSFISWVVPEEREPGEAQEYRTLERNDALRTI